MRGGGSLRVGGTVAIAAVATVAAGLLGATVALLLAVATTVATGRALTAVFGRSGDAGALAARVGSGVEHGNLAAAHGTEHRTLACEGGSEGHGCGRRGGGGFIALVGEGGRFPALGGTLFFGGREDVELGLGGGSGGRNKSGGRGLRGSAGNNRSRDDGSRGDVRRSERVLVFSLRLKNLDGGGLVGAGSGGVAGGGRRGGRGADSFAAREARAAIGTGSGAPIGGGRCGRTGGRGRGLGRRAAGRGCI